MKRNEGLKHLRLHGSWMRPSERLAWAMLLHRADNDTSTVPAFMTPSLPMLAEECGCSISAVKEALTHLERHGWLIRTRGGGRGHKTTYRLTSGCPCLADSPSGCLRNRSAHRPLSTRNRPMDWPLSSQKQADGSAQKQADGPTHSRRSTTVLHEGQRRGGVEGVCVAPGCSKPPRISCRTCFDHALQWELSA